MIRCHCSMSTELVQCSTTQMGHSRSWYESHFKLGRRKNLNEVRLIPDARLALWRQYVELLDESGQDQEHLLMS